MKVELEHNIHRCQDINNWTLDGVSFAKDTTVYYEGGASIRIAGITWGDSLYYSFPSPLDISYLDDYLYWYWRTESAVGRVSTLRLWTDASNYAEWDFLVILQNVWEKRTCQLSNPSRETGTLDLTNINRFYILFPDDHTNNTWIDYFYVPKDITSDVINGLSFIEHSIRDYPRCEFMAKGTWQITKEDIIKIYDYLTSNGSSVADQIIFEGSIIDYELTFPRKIWDHSKAKRDLDEFRPSGVYNGDLDSNHIKTLIAECSYITEGTIDATTGNTDNTFKGDITFRTILNTWADKHYKHWYLSPTGVLTFNDADIDSGVVLYYHKALYNFKNEVVGTTGTDIDFIDSLSGTPTTIIVASIDGHKKVLQHSNGSAFHNITTKDAGTIEFYTHNPDAGQNQGIVLKDGVTECLILKTAMLDQFKYNDGAAYQNVKAAVDGITYHHKVVWRVDNTFDWWIDEVKEIDNVAITNNMTDGIDVIQLYSSGVTSILNIDAFDYSWASGYSAGRNLKGELFHCWNVKPKKHVDAINWVMLKGGIVAGAQIEAESKDLPSIEQLGPKIYKDTYSIITIVAQLQITADNLKTREQLLPLAINLWSYEVNRGLIPPGECVWFAQDKANPNISPRQVIINKIIYRFLSEHTNLQTTDGIAFRKDKDAALPQENSLLLQQ